ncbi:hypothetical protein [Geotoga petraea]|jgi:hypothetical protein|nr:hypothetical protein [Geotoga petraea]SDB97962.1 hypothetical protein SAMN04488588_0127 [Geotoga petraea]
MDWGIAFESDFKNSEIEQLSKFNLNLRADLGFLYTYFPVGKDNIITENFESITIYPNNEFKLDDVHLGIYFIREKISFLELKFAVENSVIDLLDYKEYKLLFGVGAFFTNNILIEASMKESIDTFSNDGFKPDIVLGLNFLF